MKYENPDLLDRLAAEYVLCTMRGPARRRFERLCEASPAAREARFRWEDDLVALIRPLKPIQPAARVWPEIRRRIGGSARFTKSPTSTRWGWTLAAAASVAVIGLGVALFVYQRPLPMQSFAVLGTDAAHPVWLIERPTELTKLRIRAVGPVQLASGKAYELWALPKAGKPVSLGLLPRDGQLDRVLTDSQQAALHAANSIAVSLEPAGGSPTGSPTGPVVIVAGVVTAG